MTRTDQLANNNSYRGLESTLLGYSNAVKYHAMMYFMLKSELKNLIFHGEPTFGQVTQIESDMNWVIKGWVDAIEAWGYNLESFILITLAAMPDQK